VGTQTAGRSQVAPQPQSQVAAQPRSQVAPQPRSPRALERAALLSIASNTLLVTAKTAVGLLTGALSVLSEALHSGSDLLAAVIAFGAVRAASRPADKEHPFGHGKYESLSATVEGLILIAAAIWILLEAVRRLSTPEPAEILAIPGAAVMLAGVVLNIIVSMYLLRVAKKHRSPALQADGVHLRADVWTSGAVLVGLVGMHLGAPTVVDAMLALVVAGIVTIEGTVLIQRGAADLVDVAAPPAEREAIERVLGEYKKHYVAYHKLRTRRTGGGQQVDVHLVVCQKLTVGDAHEISERLQAAVKAAVAGTDMVVHIEPCDSVQCLARMRRGEEVECRRRARAGAGQAEGPQADSLERGDEP